MIICEKKASDQSLIFCPSISWSFLEDVKCLFVVLMVFFRVWFTIRYDYAKCFSMHIPNFKYTANSALNDIQGIVHIKMMHLDIVKNIVTCRVKVALSFAYLMIKVPSNCVWMNLDTFGST